MNLNSAHNSIESTSKSTRILVELSNDLSENVFSYDQLLRQANKNETNKDVVMNENEKSVSESSSESSNEEDHDKDGKEVSRRDKSNVCIII